MTFLQCCRYKLYSQYWQKLSLLFSHILFVRHACECDKKLTLVRLLNAPDQTLWIWTIQRKHDEDEAEESYTPNNKQIHASTSATTNDSIIVLQRKPQESKAKWRKIRIDTIKWCVPLIPQTDIATTSVTMLIMLLLSYHGNSGQRSRLQRSQSGIWSGWC